jgi:immune inhibitor A
MASYNAAIQRIYVSHHSQNAWAFLAGVGWRKVGTLSVDGTTNVHLALVAARAHGIVASVTTNAADDRIELVYV